MENARFVKVKLIFIKDIVLSVEMVWFMIQKSVKAGEVS